MAKDVQTFQRQVRQLRNLLEDKGVGYEKVTEGQRDLLARLGPVPGPLKDEPRLLGLFSGKNFDDWLKRWEAEARTKVPATGASTSAASDAGPSSSTANAPQPSLFQKATGLLLGSPKEKSPPPQTGPGTQPTQPAAPNAAAQASPSQPGIQAASPAPATPATQVSTPPVTPQPAATRPATQASTPQPATPQPAATRPATQASTPQTTPAKDATQASTQPAASPAVTPQAAPSSNYPPVEDADEDANEETSSHNREPTETTETATSQHTASQGAASQRSASEPVTSQPVTSQDAASQLAASQRAASQPATPQRTHQATGAPGGQSHSLDSTAQSALDRMSGPLQTPGPAAPISISSSPSPERPPTATDASGNSRQPESPPSRSGARAAQGHYPSPPSQRASDRGDNTTEPDQDPGSHDDGSTFDPDRWEAETEISSDGYVDRPACFKSALADMPSKRAFPELWHKIHDPIDRKLKWALLKGKVRKNSLAFEVPSSEGTRFVLLPPGQNKDISQEYRKKTEREVPEVPYGDEKALNGVDLAKEPPHALCFALGKGLQRRGDAFFIWFVPERWYSKSAVITAAGASAVKAYLEDAVPTWNQPRQRPGLSQEQLLTPGATPTPEEALLTTPRATPRAPPRHRDGHLPQRPRATREHLQSSWRQPQAHTTAPGPAHPSTREAPPLHPIYEGFPPGDGASGTGQFQPAEAARRNHGDQYYTPGFPGGPPPRVPGSSRYPFQPQPPASTTQAQGQASSIPGPFGFPPNPAQGPIFQEQQAPGFPPWVPWAPVYPPGYQHSQVSQPLTVPPPPPYYAGNQGRRETSHLPTPPREMGYERVPPRGSRQSSAQPVQGTANPGPYQYQRGFSEPFW